MNNIVLDQQVAYFGRRLTYLTLVYFSLLGRC